MISRHLQTLSFIQKHEKSKCPFHAYYSIFLCCTSVPYLPLLTLNHINTYTHFYFLYVYKNGEKEMRRRDRNWNLHHFGDYEH